MALMMPSFPQCGLCRPLYGGGRDDDYREIIRAPFGKPLDLPEPFSFTLGTSVFA